MTRSAIYHATPNHIVEEPTMEKPEHPKLKHIRKSSHDIAMAMYHDAFVEYNAHLATLRTIPAHDSARSLWKDGQVLTEGVDYEEHSDEDRIHRIFPIIRTSEQMEDELWKDVLADAEASIDWQYQELAEEELITKLKQKYIINKR